MKNYVIKELTKEELTETYGGGQTKWIYVNGKRIRIESWLQS